MNRNFTGKMKIMSKEWKIILSVVLAAVTFVFAAYSFVIALWSGAFNFLQPKEIKTFESPNGEYSLVFEQMGDPQWPFGPTDVRLTIRNREGKIIGRESTQLSDDGANAGEHNVGSVLWKEDGVTVVLVASEMEDKEISIAYDKK